VTPDCAGRAGRGRRNAGASSRWRARHRDSRSGAHCCATLLAAAGVAGAEPVVEPGQTLELGDFEASGGSCDTFLIAHCEPGVEDGRLIGFGDAANAFSRAELSSFHGHEFEIAASPETAETVLATQISGSVNVRGFLAMFGLGHSRAEVLLRRGHRYRLLLELRSSNKIGGLDALSTASFHPFNLEPPNLLHPDFWASALATLNSPGVSNLGADKIESNGGFNFPKIETSIGDFGGGFAAVDLAPSAFQYPSLFPLAEAKNVPLSATDIIDFLRLDEVFTPVEEEVTDPGVELTRLAVTVEQDAIEVARNRDIEDAVAQCRSRVSLYLPLANGGSLEAVDHVVESLIASNEAAGLRVRRARRFLGASRADAADGDYYDAYRNLCIAYGQITAINGG
jgi:hypothetical protein